MTEQQDTTQNNEGDGPKPCPTCGSPAVTGLSWACGSTLVDPGLPEQTFVFTPMCEYAAQVRSDRDRLRTTLRLLVRGMAEAKAPYATATRVLADIAAREEQAKI